jgi:hypothetical protein
VRFLVGTLAARQFSHVICLGAPTIYESLGGGVGNYAPRRLLMDIDARFLALLGPLDFCWFNMMNFHFFHPDSGTSVYRDFLSELANGGGNNSLAIVLDPPFGARHEILAASLQRIRRDALRMGKISPTLFWIFPYFMEKKLVGEETVLGLAMSDYRVGYENHREFSGNPGSGRKQGSPVRIFTNMPLRQVPVPYRYDKCAEFRIGRMARLL